MSSSPPPAATSSCAPESKSIRPQIGEPIKRAIRSVSSATPATPPARTCISRSWTILRRCGQRDCPTSSAALPALGRLKDGGSAPVFTGQAAVIDKAALSGDHREELPLNGEVGRVRVDSAAIAIGLSHFEIGKARKVTVGRAQGQAISIAAQRDEHRGSEIG